MAFKLPKFNIKLPKKPAQGFKVVGLDEDAEKSFYIPWLSEQSFDRQLKILSVLLLVFLGVTLLAAYFDNRAATHGTRYVALSSKLLMLSQKLAKDAASSFSGDSAAFEGLEATRADFSSIVNTLDKGGNSLAPTGGKPRASLERLLALWQQTQGHLDQLEKGRPLLVTLERGAVSQVDMIKLSNQLLANPPGGDRGRVEELSRLIDKVTSSVQLVLVAASTEELPLLLDKSRTILSILNGMPASDPTVALLKEDFEGYLSILGFIAANSADIQIARNAGKTILNEGDQLLTVTQSLVSSYEEAVSQRITSLITMLSGGLVLLTLLLLSKVYLDESRRRERESKQVNKTNQQAILRLMNELADLADGDLTVKATVSEDITGAIADSVNYTTDELRKLVVRVSSASHQVAKATADTGSVAKELLIAAKTQADELREASEAVALMSKSVQEVDNSAAQSADVARRTLAVTEQGAHAVRNTISGMDSIREQIQETSKRIKRLGESSQEIGEIVDLISDITEQTNVLALNAAIQAASAGEAGRGFSVVAEEVQRLAERSAEATKQIGALVKTIQSDTQDAVAAMEKSTQGVVEGAKLSDAAGQSLREIEQATRELADLVSSISVSTQVQTDMVSEVTAMMSDILNITEQTTYSTQRTNSSVAQLESLATELNSSVSGFKL